MKLKVITVICVIGLLTACGKEEPVQEVSEVVEPVVEEQIIEEPAIEEPIEEEPEYPTYEGATFIRVGDYKYEIIVDCPDNSDAPEIQETTDRLYFDSWSETDGVSANLVNAVLTHGAKKDYLNAAELDYDTYNGYVIKSYDEFGEDAEYTILGDFKSYWAEDNPSEIYVNLDDLYYYEDMYIPAHVCMACTLILKDSIRYTNGNITLALIRYHVGPELFKDLMQECIDATGLTEEEIYANYGADYVYQYDTVGIGDPDYANEVLQYVSGDIVITEYNGEYLGILSETTYTIVRP